MIIEKLCRKVTFRFLKLISLFISTTLGIFCSSCNKMEEISGSYGVPSAAYKVSGTVVSSDQNLPIKGLLITIRDTMSHYMPSDSTKTDSLGRYSLEFSGPPLDTIWDLNVKDIDSTEYGSFTSKDTIISISESELEDGLVEKKVDLKMDKK